MWLIALQALVIGAWCKLCLVADPAAIVHAALVAAGARPAALAYCCAEAQGRGEEMARALFAASPGELSPEGCEAIAARIGCDLDRYRADLATAEQRVASDLRDAEQAGVQALPTIFIGRERINGASASVEQLAALIARAPRS